MQIEGLFDNGEHFHLSTLPIKKYNNMVTRKQFKTPRHHALNLRYSNTRIILQSFQADNQNPNLQDIIPINNIVKVTANQKKQYANLVMIELQSESLDEADRKSLFITFVNASDAKKFVDSFNQNSLPNLRNSSSVMMGSSSANFGLARRKSSTRCKPGLNKQSSKYQKNRRQTTYFDQLSKGYLLVKAQILQQRPQLKQVYYKIREKLQQKGQMTGKYSSQFDWIIFRDDPKMKQFLRLSQVEAYQIERQIEKLSLEDKSNSAEIRGLENKFNFQHKNLQQLMEGYSYIKQLQGVKQIDQQKKAIAVIQGQNRQRENLFIAMVAQEQEHNRYNDLELSRFLQTKHEKYIDYEEQPQKVSFGRKMKIPQRNIKISQQKMQIINIETKGGTDRILQANIRQKKLVLPNEQQTILKKTIQLQKILYKFVREKDFERIEVIKDILTDLTQNVSMQHPYFQKIKKRANQNYLSFRKGKLTL